MEEAKNEEYKKEWASDQRFWENYGELMFNSGSWEDAHFDVKNLCTLLDLKEGTKVLDSCCGVGRHSIELANAKMDVSGVDITKAYIEAASDTAREMGLKIDFKVADVREYKKENYFDLIVNLYTSYGYFETEAEEEKYLQNVYASLKSGGRFLIDTISKEALARDFIEDEWFEEDGKTICLSYKIIKNFSRLVNRWMIINKDGSKIDTSFSHKIYSAVELELILKKAGFKEVEIFGSLSGDPYDHNVKRLIAVATK